MVVTKRDHASNSVLGLGWGVRVAQKVNSPEIGRASRPIRIQLVVFGDDDEDSIILSSFLRVPFGYLFERAEIQTRKSSYYVPSSVPLLRCALTLSSSSLPPLCIVSLIIKTYSLVYFFPPLSFHVQSFTLLLSIIL